MTLFIGCGEAMILVRLARTTDAPELKKLNDLFNGTDSNSARTIEESLAQIKHELSSISLTCE